MPETIISQVIEEEMKQSYVDYAMSVIIGRALPRVEDGLKPVHRRILFAMNEMGMKHNKPFKKCARIVGEVLGKFHPHGDTAVYDSLVRMAQTWSLRSLLIDGQGNFGSVDGDSAAAMRYTEARLQKYSEELLEDIDKETVDFTPNFDGSLTEPTVLPSKAPNLLINGSQGIAVGMATNIPPHNIKEVCSATVALIDNEEISTAELMEHLPGPDFPTGGEIAGRAGIASAYATGRGKVIVKAIIKEEEGQLIITEIPYLVNKAQLVEHIADLVRSKKILGIRNLRDESNRIGMRVVIELKQGAQGSVVINQLYKYTRLRTTFGIILLSIVDNEPKVLALKDMLTHFLNHRKEIIKRRTAYDLRKAEERSHLLSGLIIALDNIDAIVDGIKKSAHTEAARAFLIGDYSLSEKQANAILEMRLQKLSGLEQEKIRNEQQELVVLIEELKGILASEQKILDIIKNELQDLKERFGDERRTMIVDGDEDLDIEDLIAEQQMVITLTHNGYMKRILLETYRQQRRGGKGIIAAGRKAEDVVENIFVASTHSYLLFFTDRGQVHWCKVYNIPESSRQAAGKPVINLINIEPGDKVTSIIPIKNLKQEQYLVMCTKKGIIKKTALLAFSRPRRAGIRAITLDPDDQLVSVKLAKDDQEIIIASENGLAVRFRHTDIRPMGRSAMGVRGIRLVGGDNVVGMAVADASKNLLTISRKGFGKQTPIPQYRLISRGGKGVVNMKVTPKNGKIVDVRVIEPGDELMLISKRGIAIRISTKNISTIGRATQGVRVMRLGEGDEVVAVARIVNEEKEVEEAVEEAGEDQESKGEIATPWETNIEDKEFDTDLPDEFLEGEEE